MQVFTGNADSKMLVEDWIRDLQYLLDALDLPTHLRFSTVGRHLSGEARKLVLNLHPTHQTPKIAFGELRADYGDIQSFFDPLADFYECSQRPGESACSYAIALEALLRGVEEDQQHGKPFSDRDSKLTCQFLQGLIDEEVYACIAPIKPRLLSFHELQAELRDLARETRKFDPHRRNKKPMSQMHLAQAGGAPTMADRMKQASGLAELTEMVKKLALSQEEQIIKLSQLASRITASEPPAIQPATPPSQCRPLAASGKALYMCVTPLHIAVVNQNISLVHHLISHGGDVATPRATGLYFRKRRGGLIYFGEHVLSFAACTGNENIISMVINQGASTRVQDYLGNTVLHILVLQPNKITACQTIDLIMAHDTKLDHSVPLDMVPNLRGLTPMKVAAKEGNTVVFQHLVNERHVVHWSLGPLTSNLYDLTEIDSWAGNMSVLELIVRSHHKEVRTLLEVTPVKQLVSLKWNLYAKHYFRLLMIVYLLYILIFTLCCVFRPLKDIPENYTQSDRDKTIRIPKSLKESYVTPQDKVRLAGEIVSLLGAVAILLLEVPDIARFGVKRYFGQTALGGPFHVILITFACSVLLLLVFRVCDVQREGDVMAVCLVFCWCNVMFFSRGFQLIGPHVIMVQKIILEDLGTFMLQLFILTIAFSSGIWIVYMTQDPAAMPTFVNFPIILYTEYEYCLSMLNILWDPTIYTPPMAFVLLVVFSIIAGVLFVNLLIAIMTDTEWDVSQDKDLLWKIQVVSTILMLERKLPRCLWPRLGECGLKYGLKDTWYFRLEETNDQIIQNMRQYFSKQNERKKKESLDKTGPVKGAFFRIPDPKPQNVDRKAKRVAPDSSQHFGFGDEAEIFGGQRL
uniref:LOW QUALITY PROTEIN: transient receptor potential cation channel subfamily V member 5-like n=1 Tax=Monopterus albus TaxID=43700 RepID=UPI0009B455B5|nr:LOW QUALITY PROTEIN: transient receptor potential cation channel subfamily V member 5-like [Monopterus albus]